MTDQGGESFLDRIKRNAEREGIPIAGKLLDRLEKKAEPEVEADLIPDLGPQGSPASLELDSYLDRIDILDAYARWCGKMVPNAGSKRESIMISCPQPDHRDANPSAWINLDKQVWSCGACETGGDKFDIAAWKFDFDVPGYKAKGVFPRLKKAMVEDFFGIVVTKDITGKQVIAQPFDEEKSEGNESSQPDSSSQPDQPDELPTTPQTPQSPVTIPTLAPLASPPEKAPDSIPVISIFDRSETLWVPKSPPGTFRIDWKTLFASNTYLEAGMEAVKDSDIPDEFPLFEFIQGLGLAYGYNIMQKDVPPVHGNLYICIYAPSSTGKSKSVGVYLQLLEAALPYDHSNPNNLGTRITSLPGSPESLVDQFEKFDIDDTSGTPVAVPVPVRVLMYVPEFAQYGSRSARAGSDFKPITQELYDGHHDRNLTHSSRTRGLVTAKNPFFSIITTTQPFAIRTYLTKEDAASGFLNRFIFVRGEEKPRQSLGSEIDLTETTKELKRHFEDARTIRKQSWDRDAALYWDHVCQTKIFPLQRDDETGLLGRLDLTLKKLIFLSSRNEWEKSTSFKVTEKTVEILLSYLLETYSFMDESLTMTEDHQWQEYVLNKIKKWEIKNPTKLMPRSKLFDKLPKNANEDKLMKVVKRLEDQEKIKVLQSKSDNGRSYTGFQLASHKE